MTVEHGENDGVVYGVGRVADSFQNRLDREARWPIRRSCEAEVRSWLEHHLREMLDGKIMT